MKRIYLLVLIALLITACYVSGPVEEFLDGKFGDYVSFYYSTATKYTKTVRIVYKGENPSNYLKIYYTTDGSTPSKSSDYCYGPSCSLELFNGTELKVIIDDIGSYPVFTYNVPGNIDGMVSISSGYYSSTQSEITINVVGGGVADYWYYTVDGSTPDGNDDYIYYGGSRTIIVNKGATISVRGCITYPKAYSSVITYEVPSVNCIGDKGPAGGIIFYDKGYYSDGWRYLEAAPRDLAVYSGVPSVDYYDSVYLDKEFIFGNYLPDGSISCVYVNGTDTYSENNCTQLDIGTGKKNTDLLVAAMGESAYSHEYGSEKDENYAALLCSNLDYNGYDDWFLPSRGELRLMYDNLIKNGLGSFSNYARYWSSSESSGSSYSSWYMSNFDNEKGVSYTIVRRTEMRVRPCRAF